MSLIDFNKLFEELGSRIDNPHDYNHIVSKLFQNLSFMAVDWDAGVPFVEDPLRQKSLSLSRPVVTAAYYGLNQSSRYLKLDGVTAHGNGFLLPRKATITALWAKSRNSGFWKLEIRKNDVPISLAEVSIVDGWGKKDGLSIDVDQGDYLQLFLNGQEVDHPIACFEFAWRKI